jgi:hypothetical protein
VNWRDPESKKLWYPPGQKANKAGHWCLTHVILATCDAEIRRITVQGQPGQIVHETLSQPIARYGGDCLSFQLQWEA